MRLKSLSWIFLPFLLAVLRANGMAQIATTQIVDTIYHADGTTATGTALIAWPAFTTSFGDQVPAGNTSAVIGTGGALSISLVPNSGAIPVGTYYTVTYHLDDNSVTRQYWVVPQSATALKIAAIESTVLPTSVAIQTATKSYVDTAIAAATTGHPLDSSPLVLKAGDTMTGPLVLPGDPVSSLQASTKHYVDAALAAGLANSSTLTGQTPSYLPLATTATSSTSSSHFFENSTTSGVTDSGFLSVKSTPNCRNTGVTFTATGCDNFTYYDDGSAASNTPRNLTGMMIHGQFYGPGGWGGAEGRTSTLFGNSNNGAFVTPGIKLTQVSNMNHFGIGDSQGFQISEAMHAGTAYQSDQGSQLIYAWVGEVGHWTGTVAAGGTNTSPKVTSAGGCFAQQNQSCTVSPGGYLIDKSVVRASGRITGACTVSSIPFLGSCPTDQTNIPVPSAWGIAYGANLAPGATWDAPVAQTFTIGSGGGTGSGAFAAGDLACIIGDKFSEQRIVTAVSGAAGAQTITIPLSQPENNIAIFKGGCMHLVQDADASHNIELALPSVSLDGVHILAGYPAFSLMAPFVGYSAGSQWATYDGGASSGFHLYAGARVDRVDTTRPGFVPFADDAIVITLEPNAAFSAGDSISAPDFNAQKVDGMELSAWQDIPSTSGAQLTGLRLHIGQHGANGAAAIMRLYNDEPTSSYQPFGGPLSEPAMFTEEGSTVTSNLLDAVYTPWNHAFYFNNHQPGQTSYEIWHDPSWGQLSLDSSSTWHFTNSSITLDQGSITATSGGGFFGYGISTGEGDGAGNGAGVAFQLNLRKSGVGATWLTPCDLTSDPSKTDLCVTSQGAARSNSVVAADRGLKAGDITTPVLTNGNAGSPLLVQGGSSNTPLNLTSTDPNFTGITLTNTGTNGDQWGIYSASSGAFSGGHKLGIVNNTTGNWAWVLEIDSVSSGAIENPSFLVNCWSSSVDVTQHGCDTGLSRGAAAAVNVGNGTAGDASGTLNAATLNAQLYKGPATAPTGACSVVGWAFSQDGHISFCDGGAWTQKM